MGRWAPGGRGRLEQAAWQLFADRGYDATTVADIAERAGLTERSFYRHFADKREVLFGGAPLLEAALVAATAEAGEAASPLDALAAAFTRVATELFSDGGEYARLRLRLVSASAELRERELAKMASLSTALADALEARGTPSRQASLAADVAVAAFRQAFEAWAAESGSMADHLAAAFAEVRALAAVAGDPSPDR